MVGQFPRELLGVLSANISFCVGPESTLYHWDFGRLDTVVYPHIPENSHKSFAIVKGRSHVVSSYLWLCRGNTLGVFFDLN